MAFGIFEVHAGDFKKGKDSQYGNGYLLMKNEKKIFREKIKIDTIQSVEVASEESVKRLGGSISWGIAGGILLGPAGLLAGLIGGGKGKDVTFICVLKDGRKFLATASSRIYKDLFAATFK